MLRALLRNRNTHRCRSQVSWVFLTKLKAVKLLCHFVCLALRFIFQRYKIYFLHCVLLLYKQQWKKNLWKSGSRIRICVSTVWSSWLVKWGEVQWSKMKVLLKMVCHTCGLTTLETRYCCFSYMHFVLICTVVVLYCFVVCVCARVCVYEWVL